MSKENFEPNLTFLALLVLAHEAIKDREVVNRPNFSPFLLFYERAIWFVLIKVRPEQ